jgi:ABC-type cobalt transport system substrate-binding protein
MSELWGVNLQELMLLHISVLLEGEHGDGDEQAEEIIVQVGPPLCWVFISF